MYTEMKSFGDEDSCFKLASSLQGNIRALEALAVEQPTILHHEDDIITVVTSKPRLWMTSIGACVQRRTRRLKKSFGGARPIHSDDADTGRRLCVYKPCKPSHCKI